MKLVPLEESDLTLSEVARMAKEGEGPVILTRDGKPLAVVKDLSGEDWESVSLANNPKFVALIEKSRRSYRQEGGIGIAELRRQLGVESKPASRSARTRKKKT